MTDNYLDAQRAMIGCLIIDAEKCAVEIFSRLRPFHFGDDTFRQLFIKAQELYAEGKIDQLVLQHKTPQYRSLITDIVANTPTAANYREYMTALLEEYKLYSASLMGRKISEMIDVCDIEGVHQELDSVKRIFDETSAGTPPASLAFMFGEFTDELENKPDYIRFGFYGLDSRLYAEKGDYIVVGARPSVGKTAFALNLADEISKRYKTIFFSLETSKSKLAARYFSSVLDMDFRRIKERTLSENEKAGMADSFINVHDRKLYFEEACGMTAQEICAYALREKADVIFVDYIGLVSGEGRNDYEKVSMISKYFHVFAQKYKVMVVLLSQLNRETSRNERPDLVNLRDSGQIEQDADVIMLMHKPLDDDPLREVSIAKNKEGETGAFALDFDGRHQRFFESRRADEVLRLKRGRKENYFYVQ